MTFLKSWEEFEKAAERLYLQDPMKVRYTMKYVHKDGSLTLKLTDDVVCLQYKTEILQDLKKVDKLVNNLMRHMASKEHKLDYKALMIHFTNAKNDCSRDRKDKRMYEELVKKITTMEFILDLGFMCVAFQELSELGTMLLLTTGRPLVAPKVFICDLRRSAITEFRLTSNALIVSLRRSLYLRRVSGLPLQDLHARIPDGCHDYLLRWCDVAMCDGHVDPVLYNIGTDSIRIDFRAISKLLIDGLAIMVMGKLNNQFKDKLNNQTPDQHAVTMISPATKKRKREPGDRMPSWFISRATPTNTAIMIRLYTALRAAATISCHANISSVIHEQVHDVGNSGRYPTSPLVVELIETFRAVGVCITSGRVLDSVPSLHLESRALTSLLMSDSSSRLLLSPKDWSINNASYIGSTNNFSVVARRSALVTSSHELILYLCDYNCVLRESFFELAEEIRHVFILQEKYKQDTTKERNHLPERNEDTAVYPFRGHVLSNVSLNKQGVMCLGRFSTLFSVPWACELPSSPGTKHRQLVSMAPLTTSRLGRMTKINRAVPTEWKVSITTTTRNSFIAGLSQDLKKHILRERMAAPSSGTKYAMMRHHIHAKRSSSGSSTMKGSTLGDDTRPEDDDKGDEVGDDLEHLDGDIEALLVGHGAAVLARRGVFEHIPSFGLLHRPRAATTHSTSILFLQLKLSKRACLVFKKRCCETS
uniref:Signal recognition particle 9 kDa protein n=1 Tax=Timema douglasi TaxID=61478 RepID=A0A7R8VMA0_TIMDO|nr:unnamed protein product [Timema douglasi]